MTLKDVLLHHLEHTFEREAWQPSLAMAIEGLTAAQATWKPSRDRHSIWQIARHVTRWKQATLEAWDGTRALYRADSGPTDHVFELERTDWQDVSGNDRDWRDDCEALHTISRKIAERVARLGAEELLDPFPGEDMPAVLRLLRMATHDTYHAGQIRHLRALQGV
jgi:hypothetical protein